VKRKAPRMPGSLVVGEMRPDATQRDRVERSMPSRSHTSAEVMRLSVGFMWETLGPAIRVVNRLRGSAWRVIQTSSRMSEFSANERRRVRASEHHGRRNPTLGFAVGAGVDAGRVDA